MRQREGERGREKGVGKSDGEGGERDWERDEVKGRGR